MSGNGSDCIEVGLWNKSSLSGNGPNCVEVALAATPQAGAETAPDADRLVLVRDSKDPEGPVLSFTPSEWDVFLGMIKSGELADLG
ncbi:DUF397 domain-containing protein [Streptosporangium sp. NPDC049644]|uniref:DUF397 domain-containing protein n=1 Tax=Streptosporangium sp. NPDC049644 TaxID=3155507 RepID=UPI003443EC6F